MPGHAPRWYQAEAVEAVFAFFEKHGGRVDDVGTPVPANPVIVLPTGTGKSNVIAWIIQRMLALAPKTRAIMLVDSQELVEQNHNELLDTWPNAPVGVCCAGLRRKDTLSQILYGSVGSVVGKIDAVGWVDILIIDECHMVSNSETTQYQLLIARLMVLNPWLRVIGLSATPYRLGLGSITDNGIFTDVCYDISGVEGFRRLLREGFLAPLIPKRTALTLDVSGVGIVNGDYKQADLQSAVDKTEITYAALREACEWGQDRQSWLVFTTGIEHSDHCAEQLREFGIAAVSVHSKLPTALRRERLQDFKAGRVRAICGNNIFAKGFNHKPVDLIVCLRPTVSTAFWVQMLGRGTRPFDGNSVFRPKTNCLVLDYARNTVNLGPIDDPQLPRRKRKGNGDPPCCICEACGTYNHARAVTCIGCGTDIVHTPKIVEAAGSEALLTEDEQVFAWMPVHYMLAQPYMSKSSEIPTLKVTFISGFARYVHWVALQHTGYAGHLAREWWSLFSDNEPPVTVEEANKRFSELRTPAFVKVWTNKKYPEVVAYAWSEEACK